MGRITPWHVTLRRQLGVLILVATIAGCSGGGTARFESCGNGRLDAGEQCDDGNLVDDDDCLSGCVPARCGDSFIDAQGAHKEQCDSVNLGGKTCADLGFAAGVLVCRTDCTFDTAACAAAPTATPTPTPGLPTATPSPTPTTPPSCSSLLVTVHLSFDVNSVPDLAGLVVDLDYPPLAVEVPGADSDDSVLNRVSDVSGANGIGVIEDRDTDGDTVDDQIHNAYVTSHAIAPGAFETVLFDCQPSAGVPPSSAFVCTVSDPADSQGFPVQGVACTLSLSASAT